VLTFVLGGMRSGKSEIAEQLAAASGAPVTVIATARRSAADTEFTARIDRHRARRPPEWTTIEVNSDLPRVLGECPGTVLVDTLGTYVAGAPDFCIDSDELCRALRARHGDTIVVSDEVGLAVHPATEAGRSFADALGECNRAVSTVADRVLLVVAGRTLELGPASLSDTDA
jgi:adenosyl cobinamide kinase/adenosyl cobinamide phosphate guanylyltransferase